MSELSEFYLESSSSVIQLELLELSHSSFSKIYRFVRNDAFGVSVTLDGTPEVEFEYLPMQITRGSSGNDLDQVFQIQLGDVGEYVPAEVDRIASDDSFDERPKVRYWTYRSDDLTTPLEGPVRLEVTNFAHEKSGVGFEAHAPYLNISKTGEEYSINRFPMLRGFL